MSESAIHQIEINGPQMDQNYILPEGKTTIGRQATNDLVLVHPLVSRRHAELVVTTDTCLLTLTDLASTHGTRLNEDLIEPETAVALSSGDIIEIGAFQIVYHKIGTVESEPPPVKDPVVAEEKPVAAKEKPVVVEEKPVVTEEKPVAAKEKPMVAEEEPVVAEEKPVVAEEEPVVAEEKSATGKKKSVASKKKPAETTVSESDLILESSSETEPPPPLTEPQPAASSVDQIQDWKTAKYVPIISSGGSNGSSNGNGSYTANGDGGGKPFALPPGQSYHYSRYLEYLPEIYRTNGETFIPRFLALLESILAPVEWTGDNFDLFLDSSTAPAGFLPWLANWYELYFDSSWSEIARRTVLQEAHLIYRRRGTAWALQRLLEIYTGATVQIDDQNENLEDFTFSVRIATSAKEAQRPTVERLINANKPAHTSYDLLFTE